MGIALIIIGGLVMPGANLVSLPSVLRGDPYTYGTAAAWGLAGFAVVIVGTTIGVRSLPLWAALLSMGFWLRGPMYASFGLRWFSGVYRKKQRRR